ncbi:NAD(P)/FAD-dependent oxidoreductase, partial [Desulfothermus sp.]
KKLGVPGEEEFTGRGVSYCALCDGMFFKDQVVACIGGGNTALEESLYLAKLAQKVYLIHRRDQFRGYKIYQERVLQNPKIEVIYDSVVEEIRGKDNVEEILILNKKTQNKTELKVDGVFVFIGIAPNSNFIPKDVDVDPRGFIKTDNEMQTNLPGIFAAGDVRAKTCRQVVTAVGDGAQAAHSAYLFLQEKD